ncbi:ribulose-phosphate 3-epimerase [Evansella halocellulosilytica]|uniref:ribulose-phosphate 3-epimerase n=1 Tax=Evansella halocellulosilytica TaxID=2011013 RepID=UPI000BB88EE0|nr:ribulose-phosphate 3-epimerase [Evansella halocellulosilytica]
MAKVGPSLMCAKLDHLRDEMKSLEDAKVDYYHLDIMDGQFVPNFTLGPDLIRSVRGVTNKPFDLHLMVNDPERYIDIFHHVGADMMSVHLEATTHIHRTLEKIKQLGIKAGVALNPSTSIQSIDYIADMVDYVCVMTVNPGFSGQTFIPSMFKKIELLKNYKTQHNYNFEIQVDGNISFENIPKVTELGADLLVCGTSSLFNQKITYQEGVEKIRSYCKSPVDKELYTN